MREHRTRWGRSLDAGDRRTAAPEAKKDVILGMVAEAGIVGMGGAGFPTHVKLSPPPNKPINTLIVNGAECEPYLTADHRLMVENAQQIWAGARVIRKLLGARTVRIAVEDNKPDAIAAMEQATADDPGDVAVVPLRTEYPQGAEKQQIHAITGREVPSGGLPMDVGALVENVATAMAVWDAVVNGRPLTARVTTVTGGPVGKPGNVYARVGTAFADLVEFCGGVKGSCGKIIAGGPMMGLAQATFDAATSKTTSGLLLLSPAEVQQFTSMPCIGCGRCVGACPMNLMPSELSQMLEAEDYDSAEDYRVLDCIECGCCAYVCPAHRPLVQHMKQGKAKVMLKRKQAQQRAAEEAAGK
ncbi:electron transport complex subunit RsxC [Verrucomicrobiota bacterium]